MSPRTGRPKVDNPKNNDVKVRLDDKTKKQLDDYCFRNKETRAGAIRKGINLLLDNER